MDLISRQEAIDAFKTNGSVFVYGVDVCNAIISRIKLVTSAQPEPQWIPCSERLPEKENVYIVCFEPDQLPENVFKVDVVYWLDGKWQSEVLERYEHRMPELVMEPFKDITVIAWMPLPEPWRGEEHETD